MIRVLFGVALLVLSCADTRTAETEGASPRDRALVLSVFQLFAEANEATRVPEGQGSFTPPAGVAERQEELLERSLSVGAAVSDTFLDSIHPEMQRYFREKLLAGQQKYLDGLRSGDVDQQVQGIQLVDEFQREFWQPNLDAIEAALLTPGPASLSFGGFLGRLFAGSFLAPILFSLVSLPLLAPAAAFAAGSAKPGPLIYLLAGLAGCAQLYFWLLWAAYCASVAAARTGTPGVEYTWLYYVMAGLFLVSPLAWLQSKEEAAGGTSAAQNLSAMGYQGAVIAGFVAFAIWPWLAGIPYGWILPLISPGNAA